MNDKQDKKKKALMGNLTAQRPGIAPEPSGGFTLGVEENKAQGLLLSAVQFKKLDLFRTNEMNIVFEELKSPEYYDQLKRDIAQDGIINALIAMPDGELIEGHSRLRIAKELDYKTVPVRYILNTLTEGEIKRRVYLGNLNRFEIPSDMRLALFAEVYPDYFHETPDKLAQSHQRSEGEDGEHKPTTAKSVAKAMGLSDRQVRNEKEVFLKAKELSHMTTPTSQEIALAREILKQEKAAKKLERSVAKFVDLVDAQGQPLLTIHVASLTNQEQLNALIMMNERWFLDQGVHVKRKGE